MHEILTELLSQLRGAWRFRWHAVALAWGIGLIGWIVVAQLPPSYTARARVFVDSETVLRPLLDGIAVETNVASDVGLMSSVLLSRPNLEKVARETDLYLRATSPQEQEQLIDGLAKNIKLEGGRDSTYGITYTDANRMMAQRVVQTLLNTFVEDTLGIKREDTTSAQRFLEKQIAEYEVRLREAEERVANFKRQNVGLMPGETGDYYTRLQTGMTSLEDTRTRLRLATERRAELMRQLEGEEPSFGLAPGSASGGRSSPLDVRIGELRARREQLLIQYTEKHPEVVAIEQQIAQLEEQKQSSRGSAGYSSIPEDPARSAARALNVNPVYQSMKIALSQTELEIVDLRNRLAQQSGELGSLRGKVNTIPEVEAQLARLNRDYEVVRGAHAALVQRLESARLSENADRSKDQVKFRIIEPPLAPLQPNGPNRVLLWAGVMLFALLAGAALAIVMNQIVPVFSSRAALGAVTGLPVLSAIKLIPPRETPPLLRRQPVMVGGSFAALVVFFCISMLLAGPIGRLAQSVFH